MRSRWQHLVMVTLLLSGVYVVTKGDSCSERPAATVIAPAPADTPLDQLEGVIIIVSLVNEAGLPVPGVKTTLSWNPDTEKMAGIISTGMSDDAGQVTFSGFADADFGTWNLTAEGNFTESIPRPRKATNPNRLTHVVKVVPTPEPTPSPTPTPEPTPTPTPTPTVSATSTPVVTSGGGGGGSGSSTVSGSGPVNTQVIITPGSPMAADPNANFVTLP